MLSPLSRPSPLLLWACSCLTRPLDAITADKEAVAKTAGAAVIARTANKEAIAKTAVAAVHLAPQMLLASTAERISRTGIGRLEAEFQGHGSFIVLHFQFI